MTECFSTMPRKFYAIPHVSYQVVKPSAQKLKHFPGRDARNIQGQ